MHELITFDILRRTSTIAAIVKLNQQIQKPSLPYIDRVMAVIDMIRQMESTTPNVSLRGFLRTNQQHSPGSLESSRFPNGTVMEPSLPAYVTEFTDTEVILMVML